MHIEKLIDSKALARRFGVTVETIRAWFRRGWIPGYRAGRRPLLFDPNEVEHALRDRALTTKNGMGIKSCRICAQCGKHGMTVMDINSALLRKYVEIYAGRICIACLNKLLGGKSQSQKKSTSIEGEVDER